VDNFGFVLADIKGASHVIGCKSRLYDAAALQLSTLFYTYYANGMSMENALDQASTELFVQWESLARIIRDLLSIGYIITLAVVLAILGEIFGFWLGLLLDIALGIMLLLVPGLSPDDMYAQFMADLGLDKMMLYSQTEGEPPPGGGSPPGGGGGCPILSVYDGDQYVSEGLLDIHASEDIVRRHWLTTTPEPVGHRYKLRLTEHPLTISHIDSVQLIAVLQGGRLLRLPLISAVHSVHGSVLRELLTSDDVRVDTLGANHNNGNSEYIDLQFAAPQGLRIVGYCFAIEGYNAISKT
jgi:hypothetical protein